MKNQTKSTHAADVVLRKPGRPPVDQGERKRSVTISISKNTLDAITKQYGSLKNYIELGAAPANRAIDSSKDLTKEDANVVDKLNGAIFGRQPIDSSAKMPGKDIVPIEVSTLVQEKMTELSGFDPYAGGRLG